jgi:hypothetical protein
MKKIPDSTTSFKYYKGIQLYRDDIEWILLVLQENQFDVKIKDKMFEYDSLDELIEKCGVTPNYFEIDAEFKSNGGRASLNVSFERKQVRLYSGYEQKESIIALKRIGDVLDSKFSRPYKILNPWIWYWFISPVIVIYPSNYNRIPQMPLWLNTLSILFVVTFISSALYRRFKHQIILKRKHEGGFLKRHADTIWLLIIGTAIGIFLKFIFDVIWKAI